LCYNIAMDHIKARNLLLPSIICAVLFLIFFTHLIASPNTVWAFTQDFNQKKLTQEKVQEHRFELSLIFPSSILQWRTEIEKQAASQIIDPNLIAAVILQESGGDPLAYSSSGAVGLMQVMPRDGLAAGFLCNNVPCFQLRPSTQELNDPQFNIEYGSKMLKDLYLHYGNWRDALMYYGPYDVGYRYADLVLSLQGQYSPAGEQISAG
jgi:hypothetical protein